MLLTDQLLGFAAQDTDLHVVPREPGVVARVVGAQRLEPASGGLVVPPSVEGHRQEGRGLGARRAASGLNAFLQPADRLIEPAGAVQRGTEGRQDVRPPIRGRGRQGRLGDAD
jgi:hypothetical protein